MQRVLIVGGRGGIASALIQHLQQSSCELMVIGRSRPESVTAYLQADVSDEHSIPVVRDWLASGPLPDLVVVCSGLLHHANHGPEKTLRDVNDRFFFENIQANVLAHVHVAQALGPLLRRDSALRWLSLSAMVGSITDNRLGGWYSYRMSKAALNMFIRTLSIEWQRKAPQTAVIAVHPGTTDTALSLPFQANVSPTKLYQPQLTAERIMAIAATLTKEDSGYLYHWDGSRLPF